MQIIVFSKDRALQLRATLDSLQLHCSDLDDAFIRVLYTASSARHATQYRKLRECYKNVTFVTETDFQLQLLGLILDARYLMFLVDDNIFYKQFTLQEVLTALEEQPEALGLSLRLGRNTNYCHTRDESQGVPELDMINDRVARIEWLNADCDFGYPLELSSTVYNAAHIHSLLSPLSFSNPNILEAELSKQTGSVENFKWLLIFETSVTFCNPLNRVQSVYENPISKESIDAEVLADYFDEGSLVDVASYIDAVPTGAHYEMPLKLVSAQDLFPDDIDTENPFISVIIPIYNGAEFLSEAVESISAQNYDELEVIIVNDGSTDNSSEVAKGLVHEYPQLGIVVIDKENGGLASARNTGISKARGAWVLPLDCDDCFAPGFLEKSVQAIKENPLINLVFANMQEFGASSSQWIPEPYSIRMLLEKNTFPYASLYRRELWSNAGGYDPSVPWGAEDWNFWLSCSLFGIVSHRIEAPLFRYRVHPEGSMYTRMMERWDLVKSCLHTMHPNNYSAAGLLHDQEVIASMESDTVEKIDDILKKHPELPMPHFWKGLVHEKAEQFAEAVAEYTVAGYLVPYHQWQVYFRLCLVNSRLGRRNVAKENGLAVILRRPELAQALKDFIGTDLKKILPLNIALKSNLAHWKMMQENNYFENHFVYNDAAKQLKDFGDDLEWINERVTLDKTMNVVVLGCGYGREAVMIAPKVKQLFGIDVSSRILDKCRRRLKSKGVSNFVPVEADVWKYKISEEIDFVYCITVFQHLTRDLVEDYLTGLGMKLSANGTILCQFAELPGGTDDARLEVYEPSVIWTRPQIKELISKVGLELIDLETVELGTTSFWHWAFMKRRED